MTFLVKFNPTNLRQKKPSICSTYLMYFLYKKTPFRVCSFGGLLRTCLQTRESTPSTTQKNTLSGVFFWWTTQNVFTNTRIHPVHYTKKHPFGCVLLVDGDGFEPSKAVPADLQSDPFGRSGTRPGAGDWSRTNNLLITNQLLCH